ncbi:hypothetical protein EYC80_004772 [Monilinia laxa]|uniref:Uncharacterized protein n=1 Tax=Monilinia laxa TaxID=61186 RepID=A0A5N6KJF3_MONLA|nr:hypothetical protein EYC80_004772 [Monilinia laxa]
MKRPKKATVHQTVSATGTHNTNAVSSSSEKPNGVDRVSAKSHKQASSLTSHEKSPNVELAEQCNISSDGYFNTSLQTPGCDVYTDKSSICAHCSYGGQDYDAWSDNTGGHGFTTEMNGPGDRIQLQIWSYETSYITVAERLEQRKWCDPGPKL